MRPFAFSFDVSMAFLAINSTGLIDSSVESRIGIANRGATLTLRHSISCVVQSDIPHYTCSPTFVNYIVCPSHVNVRTHGPTSASQLPYGVNYKSLLCRDVRPSARRARRSCLYRCRWVVTPNWHFISSRR